MSVLAYWKNAPQPCRRLAVLGACLLGTAAAPLPAAEWSITPTYSASVDYDSNRRLLVEGKSSDATVLGVDLLFKRALEDLQLTIQPHYAWRRFSDSSLGNGDDRAVSAGFNRSWERSALGLTAAYWDQSTLLTELLETGIISGQTHRRMSQAGASWSWNQTERRSLFAQLSYQDVSYYGRTAALLPGYRYPSATVGERFAFNERGIFALSAFGTRLQSDTVGNSSRETGVQGEITYQFSERTNLDASLGESSRVLSGKSSSGTSAAVSLIHTRERDKASLAYSRSLVPYGNGFLVERQQYSASFVHSWSPKLDSTLSLFRVQNNETTVLLRLDRKNYTTLSAALNWRPLETWAVAAQAQAVRTQAPDLSGDTVKGWRGSVSLTWSPFPRSRSW